MDVEKLISSISYSLRSHLLHPNNPAYAFRIWDKETPYGIHPVWCAMTILHETGLSKEIRENGAEALLFHDILEDTSAKLPEGTSPAVRELVDGMIFLSFKEEKTEVWNRKPEIRLLKLYDKVSNMLDGSWRKKEDWNAYLEYTLNLIDDVESHFGPLNISHIARSFKPK